MFCAISGRRGKGRERKKEKRDEDRERESKRHEKVGAQLSGVVSIRFSLFFPAWLGQEEGKLERSNLALIPFFDEWL